VKNKKKDTLGIVQEVVQLAGSFYQEKTTFKLQTKKHTKTRRSTPLGLRSSLQG
jgi:hypothetical protein